MRLGSLARLSEIPGLQRIVVTNYPKVMTDDLLQAARPAEVARYLHVPAQSGSDAVCSR